MAEIQYKKILVIRFSSIGDIVLTTPLLRAIKSQLMGIQLHFVCKDVFATTLQHNPYIDQLYTFTTEIDELLAKLQSEHYDLIIDLHNNLRSYRLIRTLGVKAFHFPKLNVRKFIAVNFKKLHVLPSQHIVDRYFQAVEKLRIMPDGKGLDYFITETDHIDITAHLAEKSNSKFIALVVGGSYFTKQIPLNKLNDICHQAVLPIVILGGKADAAIAAELCKQHNNLVNLCGQLSLNQSASVIQQAEWVITSDTGLMHIASAYNKKIISVWGNTIPQFGMPPYMPNSQNKILEVKNLPCRPCSKLGYKKCPIQHFKCMQNQDFSFLKDLDTEGN